MDLNEIAPDADAERARLAQQHEVLAQWEQHPVTKEIFTNSLEEEKNAINTLLNTPVKDLGSLVTHFELRGYVRGIRQERKLVEDSKDEIKNQIKQL